MLRGIVSARRPHLPCRNISERDFNIIDFSDMPAVEKRHLMCCRLVEDAEMERINAGLKEWLSVCPKPARGLGTIQI